MQAKVSQLFKAGRPLSRDKQLKMFEGDMNVSEHLNPCVNRLVSEACLLHSNGAHVIKPMIDVRLVSTSASSYSMGDEIRTLAKAIDREARSLASPAKRCSI